MKKYSVKCDEKYLNNLNHRRLNNLKIENSVLSFDTNDINQFNDIEMIEVINNYNSIFKLFINKYFISLLGVILFCLLLFILTKTITKIEFVNDYTYNNTVYQYVDDKLYKMNKFAFLKENLVNLNKDIRKNFYDYQWINVEKKGTVLYINITDDRTLINDENESKSKGLYSKYDSIVEGYYVESGTINVKIGHSVVKGDLLIDNHVKHYNSDLEEVEAKGYVYGTVTEHENIIINKTETQVIRSGNKESFLLYEVLNKVINSPESSFIDYEVEYEDVVSFGNLLKIKRMVFYEIITITTNYSQNDAIEYGESIINSDFKKIKKYDFEKINEIKMVSIVENEYDYEILYLVSKKIDLCE